MKHTAIETAPDRIAYLNQVQTQTQCSGFQMRFHISPIQEARADQLPQGKGCPIQGVIALAGLRIGEGI